MSKSDDGTKSVLKRVMKVFGASAALGLIAGLLAPPKKRPESLPLPLKREPVNQNGHEL